MINTQMRSYGYSTYSTTLDAYGEETLTPVLGGTIKMAINVASQYVQDNINYSGAQYIGITHDANISDKYVIAFGDDKLKVLYVNKMGRFNQVFMARM